MLPLISVARQNSKVLNLPQTRHFWRWLNHIFNLYEPNIIREVVPDVAAARWASRCGAAVRFAGQKSFIHDYNALPKGGEVWHLEAIDGDDSSISAAGFQYFAHLKHLKELKLIRCDYVCDLAMNRMVSLSDCLEYLEVISCGSVTDRGVAAIIQLKNLKKLYLYDLTGVSSREDCLRLLKTELPKTNVSFPPTEGPVKKADRKGLN